MIQEKYITTPQIKLIHVLLGKLGIMERKAEIMCDISNGRTMHCSELTCAEASHLIKSLEEKQNREKQPKITAKGELIDQIYRAAFDFGIIYGDTSEDKAINLYLIDKFCYERGAVKKSVFDMTCIELKKTLQQFNAINKQKRDKQSKQIVNHK